MTRDKKLKAKHGGHDPDKVLLGLHVTPEWKAIAKLTALLLERDVTDIILDGLATRATEVGIMANGKVAEQYDLQIKAIAEHIRNAKKERQNRND